MTDSLRQAVKSDPPLWTRNVATMTPLHFEVWRYELLPQCIPLAGEHTQTCTTFHLKPRSPSMAVLRPLFRRTERLTLTTILAEE
jgi:hypothetical protein